MVKCKHVSFSYLVYFGTEVAKLSPRVREISSGGGNEEYLLFAHAALNEHNDAEVSLSIL